MKNSHKSLFLLLAIFLLIRFPLIYFPLDLNMYDFYFPSLQRFIGMFAIDLLEGLRLPVWDYFADSYGIGNLVMAIWTAPFIYLFGQNLFAVKLAALCWHMLAFVVWYYMLQSFYSVRKTFFIMLFLVLSPPEIMNLFLHSVGYHSEMILWVGLTLLALGKFLDGRLNERNAGLLLGFLGGFSSGMVITNWITVIIVLVYVALFKGREIKKSSFYLYYAVTFVIGFSPVIYLNYLMGWELINFVRERVLDPSNSATEVIYNGIWTVRHSMGVLLDVSVGSLFLRHLFRNGYALLYVFSLIYLTWIKRGGRWRVKAGLDIEVFGIYFQWFLLILFVKSGSLDAPWYLMPLVPFMGLTLVGAAESLEKGFAKSWGMAYRALLVIICLLGSLLGTLKIFSTLYPKPPSTFFMQGHYYPQINYILGRNLGMTPVVRREKLRKFVQDRNYLIQAQVFHSLFFEGYGFDLFKDLDEIIAFIEKMPEEFWPILYENFGKELHPLLPLEWDAKRCAAFMEGLKIPHDYYRFVYRGLVQSVPELDGQRLLWGQRRSDYSPIPSWVEPQYALDYLNALGKEASFRDVDDIQGLHFLIHLLKGEKKEEFFKGFSDGIFLEADPYRKLKIQQRFEELSLP